MDAIATPATCDFLLHDCEHAHKFFGDPESHRGQMHFSGG
jgi:hypothetical protein